MRGVIMLAAVGLALSVVGCGADSSGPGGRFGITGTVVDSVSRTAVAGAFVEVGNVSTHTDSSGIYLLKTVPSGVHTLSASRSGYLVRTVPISVDRDQVIDLRLVRVAPWISGMAIINGDAHVAWSHADGVAALPTIATFRFKSETNSRSLSSVRYTDSPDPASRSYEFNSSVLGRLIEVSGWITDNQGHTASFRCTPLWVCRDSW